MHRSTNRYAVYWSPSAQSPLGRFGNGWLGRDPAGDPVTPVAAPDGWTRDTVASLVADPARYGFHATLKPPFRLAADRDEEGLLNAVRNLAAVTAPVAIEALKVRAIGRFVAMTPDPSPWGLAELAAVCVRDLDGFRAPADDAELARRRQAGLSALQEDLLQRWGYPYVMEEFRFHLTLTGPVADGERPSVVDGLSRAAAGACGPVRINDLSVFREPAPGTPFDLIARIPLGAG